MTPMMLAIVICAGPLVFGLAALIVGLCRASVDVQEVRPDSGEYENG